MKKRMVGSLKLKERLDAGLPNTSPSSDTSEPPQPGMGSPPPPVDDWLISIKRNLEKAGKYDADRPWGKVSIYRVPLCLRDPLRKEAYIPQVVSLGPYHHGRKHLQPMELHKWRALNNILRRNNQSIELYVDSMKELEDSARASYEGPLKLSNNGFAEMMMYEGQLKLSCNEFAEMMMYEGQLELSSNEFGEMMMLDGCFVLELFHGYAIGYEKLGYAWNDPVFSMKGKLEFIRREMLLLENQIPLIVLVKLFELQLDFEGSRDQAENEVAQRAINFLKPLMKTDEPSTSIDVTKLKSATRDSTTSDPKSAKVGLHCLDVFRKYPLCKGPDNVQSSTRDSTTSDPKSAKVGLHCLDVFRKYPLCKGPDNVQSSTRYSTTSDPQSDEVGLHCLDVFKNYLFNKGPDNVQSSNRDSTTSDPQSAKDGRHCLGVFRKRSRDDRRQQLIPCVTDLKDSGIKFRGHTSTDRFWDIQFNNGVLDIPQIVIHDGIKPMLCNLIAFEKCHFDCKQDITNYVAFLDDLINSAKDVSYLGRDKIIENLLGSDREVADLLNSLGQEVVFDDSRQTGSYSKLYEDINKHCDRKWNSWRATLKQKYFNNPWSILSLVAAVMLLLLTAAQTFYTVYDYYK